jgi:hypothetical protein
MVRDGKEADAKRDWVTLEAIASLQVRRLR